MPIYNLEQNYFIWYEKKGKTKIGHKKSEEKDEFESPRNESLVFQRGYPNHVWPMHTCFNFMHTICANPYL